LLKVVGLPGWRVMELLALMMEPPMNAPPLISTSVAVTVVLLMMPPEMLTVVALTGAMKRTPVPLRLKVTAFTTSPNEAPLIVPPD
jgi:hypothetical protein